MVHTVTAISLVSLVTLGYLSWNMVRPLVGDSLSLQHGANATAERDDINTITAIPNSTSYSTSNSCATNTTSTNASSTSCTSTNTSSSYSPSSAGVPARSRGPALANPRSSTPRPHIVFILADDQGYHDVGYHGAEIRTRALDRLSAQGVRLENYYVQPVCTPTRSQLLSGRYQIHTGLQHSIIRPRQPSCLPLHLPTLPERLRDAGYATHMVGKWHLGFCRPECLPTRRGFDSFLGSLAGSGDHFTHEACDGPAACGLDLRVGEHVARAHGGRYSTEMYAARAVRLVEEHDAAHGPLFLYVAFQAVHTPLQAPPRYTERYRRIANQARRRYAGMLSCLDEAVHNITEALHRRGLYNNSVLVYSSDNGGQPLSGGSNWPLRGRKGTYWEGGVRALGFVHSPLLRLKGRVSRALVHVSDWFPTLLALAGAGADTTTADPASPALDGHDVWRALSEGAPSPRTEILHNIDPLYNRARGGSRAAGHGLWNTGVQAALRQGDWKILTGDPGYGDWVPPQTWPAFRGSWWALERAAPAWSSGGGGGVGGGRGGVAEPQTLWLFNLSADPFERYDVSARHPDVVRHLLGRLAEYARGAVPVRFPADDSRAHPALQGGVWGPWLLPRDGGARRRGEGQPGGGSGSGVFSGAGAAAAGGRSLAATAAYCRLCKLRSYLRKLRAGRTAAPSGS
ncbi:arylsulfatase I [Lethenteron reissneri]|uniref:arylsulfatase I n=1 Tax=Lethenteron reissneri TaxID=7753 RepID=UPI002AB69D58|nr:arylsulfatase I [Lethenteron reissneri]